MNKPALRWVQSVPGILLQYYRIFFYVVLLGREQVMMYFKLFIVVWKNCGQVPSNWDIPEHEGKLLNVGFASSFL